MKNRFPTARPLVAVPVPAQFLARLVSIDRRELPVRNTFGAPAESDLVDVQLIYGDVPMVYLVLEHKSLGLVKPGDDIPELVVHCETFYFAFPDGVPPLPAPPTPAKGPADDAGTHAEAQ